MVYGQLGPGTTIADRYELQQLLGEGGMGEVWKARHKRLDSPVAIKFVRYEGNDRSRFHDRFEREAQLAASVKHRNVVTIIDYGETPEGIAYMVMDYLDGESLSSFVRTAFEIDDIVHIVAMALRGLMAVHTAGIIHRDLKPDNIFLVRDASGLYPKLLDFGISRQTDQSQSKRSAVTTQQGVLLGTPAYMSPEQARGLKDIDRRTDIYSMGVLLYEALAGQLPFDAEHVGDLMVQVISGRPKHLKELCPDLPQALCDVVMRSMARERHQRFQTAEEMRVALLAAMGGKRELMLSERPTPPPVERDSSVSLTDSMQEPFQSMIGASPRPSTHEPTITTNPTLPTNPSGAASAARASQAAVTSVGPQEQPMLQTLDGTSVDIVLKPMQRKWMALGALAALLVIVIATFALSGDDTPDVVVTPLEHPNPPSHDLPAGVAEPVVVKPTATAPIPAAPTAAVEVAPTANDHATSVDAGPREPSAAEATPTPQTTSERSAARVAQKRPAKTTKTKSKVLTELDY